MPETNEFVTPWRQRSLSPHAPTPRRPDAPAEAMDTIDTRDRPTPTDSDGDGQRLVCTIVVHADFRRLGDQHVSSAPRAPLLISRSEPEFQRPAPDGPEAEGAACGRPLQDPHVSRTPIRLIHTGVDLVIEPGGKPITVDGVRVSEPIELRGEALEAGVLLRLARTAWILVRQGTADPRRGESAFLIGSSPEAVNLRHRVRLLARSRLPVLLVGEAGTGKARLARSIFDISSQPGAPWVELDPKASPATADDPVSVAFERARGGALSIRELGELSAEAQAGLLRILDRQEAAGRRSPDEPRLIACTSVDPARLVEQGRLRPALLHRLAATVLPIRPLRDRREDIAAQVRAVALDALEELEMEADQAVSAGLLHPNQQLELLQQAWPGNSRELDHKVRELVLKGPGGWQSGDSHLPPASSRPSTPSLSRPDPLPVAPVLPPTAGLPISETPLPSDTAGPDRALIHRLDRLLIELINDPDLSVELLGKRMGLSRRQLHREIRRVVGLPPKDWLNERRMLLARDLLRSGKVRTVSQVAAQVGLSPAWFSKSYLAHFGICPSDERA